MRRAAKRKTLYVIAPKTDAAAPGALATLAGRHPARTAMGDFLLVRSRAAMCGTGHSAHGRAWPKAG